jgi:hypothetical protein
MTPPDSAITNAADAVGGVSILHRGGAGRKDRFAQDPDGVGLSAATGDDAVIIRDEA